MSLEKRLQAAEEGRLAFAMKHLSPRDGVALIQEERDRQKRVKGWTAEHDDGHTDGSLAEAAASYILAGSQGVNRNVLAEDLWPWRLDEFRADCPRIRQLVKAGALIAAEVDRLRRLEVRTAATQPTAGGGME